MAFKKGQSGNPAGRKKGTPNKITKTVREAVHEAFTILQEDPKAKLSEWGRQNPDKFYLLASKLIPTEVNARVEEVTVKNIIIKPASEKAGD